MGWVDEQIKAREQKDDAVFREAIEGIGGAVIGRRLSDALRSQEVIISALEEILHYFHLQMEELSEKSESLEEQLDDYIRPHGIARRKVILEKGWYKTAAFPMLGTLSESGRVVALLPGKISGYYYLDLVTGKKIKVGRRTQLLLDDEAIMFYKPFPATQLRVRDLVRFMLQTSSAFDYAVYIAMLGVATLLGLLMPLFSKWLFGPVITSGSYRMLLALAGYMLCFAISKVCLEAFQGLIRTKITCKQDIAVEAAVMSRILQLPPGFFKEYSAGEMTQRASYVQSVCSELVSSVGITGLTSVFSLIYVAQIFAFAPSLVWPAFAIIIVSVLMSVIATAYQMKITRELYTREATTGGLTYALISGMQKIRLAGAEKRMFALWARSYRKGAALKYNPPLFVKLSGTIQLAISLIGTMVLYVIAFQNQIGFDNYIAFNAAYGMAMGAFSAITGLTVTFANIRPALEMAKPILETVPEVEAGKKKITSLRGGISLNNVSFRYDAKMPYVIDNLSLTIRKGEYVAIVGSTGCGKSTLLRLLLGFETPEKGAIFYDREDISKVDIQSLRRKIGVVLQDGKLFTGDIYSNIVISAPQVGLDGAWEAARLASIDTEIEAMPMGMHTLIAEGQGGISGGQRQRILIARAIAGKPKILMFDEATSALDNVTQKKVSEAIDQLDCTRIVIAHRLSTIQHCDRIIYLDGGRIVEDGTYEELIAKDGYFAKLVERQRLDK